MPKSLGKIFERRAQSQCSEFGIRAASEERRIISKTTNAGRQSRNAEAENRKFQSAVRFVFCFFLGPAMWLQFVALLAWSFALLARSDGKALAPGFESQCH